MAILDICCYFLSEYPSLHHLFEYINPEIHSVPRDMVENDSAPNSISIHGHIPDGISHNHQHDRVRLCP